jgi:NAD(P)-dependent dehydrogenase (short-subunit alcohol dehydrogenase family)
VNFSGQVVIVTGAGKGLGRAYAEHAERRDHRRGRRRLPACALGRVGNIVYGRPDDAALGALVPTLAELETPHHYPVASAAFAALLEELDLRQA